MDLVSLMPKAMSIWAQEARGLFTGPELWLSFHQTSWAVSGQVSCFVVTGSLSPIKVLYPSLVVR